MTNFNLKTTRRRATKDVSKSAFMARKTDKPRAINRRAIKAAIMADSFVEHTVADFFVERRPHTDMSNSPLKAILESNGYEGALKRMNDKFSKLPEAKPQPVIYKVHKHLRDVNAKAYEPEIIAIGPYHHGKPDLKIMEEHKVRYLKSLLQRKNQSVVIYISTVGKLEQQARDCYAEPISLNAAEFVEMLVLDGCFIIELMQKSLSTGSTCRDNDPIFEMDWIFNSVQRDLILFENQIPFFVLCKLFDLIVAPDQQNKLTENVSSFFESLYPGKDRENRANWSPKMGKHLLDLLHSNWRPSDDPENRTNRSPKWGKHLLDLLHCNWRPSDDVIINVKNDTLERESRIIHSATELKDANVEFQMRNSHTLFKLEFKKGQMLMPPLTIEDRTGCFFRNLIAYEQYFPNNQPTFITDYVALLDCLINSPKDVEILSHCGIINNHLGDYKVVADIFNQLTDSVTCTNKFVYAATFRRINKHCQEPRNRAIAVLKRDYFASSWAILSFLAALVLLLLTVAQTVFSALQVF